MRPVASGLPTTLAKRLRPPIHSPDARSGECRRTVYKRFTSVSPDQSGHCPRALRAPMLGGQPLTDMVSSKQTRSARLWIRRVLVRSQEGQLEARCDIESCRASTVLDPLFGLVRRVLFEGQIEF